MTAVDVVWGYRSRGSWLMRMSRGNRPGLERSVRKRRRSSSVRARVKTKTTRSSTTPRTCRWAGTARWAHTPAQLRTNRHWKCFTGGSGVSSCIVHHHITLNVCSVGSATLSVRGTCTLTQYNDRSWEKCVGMRKAYELQLESGRTLWKKNHKYCGKEKSCIKELLHFGADIWQCSDDDDEDGITMQCSFCRLNFAGNSTGEKCN